MDTPNGYEGGFWGGGAGVAADLSGSIYAATGNGKFDLDRGGTDYGDSVLRLVSYTGHSFTVLDYFTPWDQQTWTTTTPIWAPAAWFCCLTSWARPIPTC